MLSIWFFTIVLHHLPLSLMLKVHVQEKDLFRKIMANYSKHGRPLHNGLVPFIVTVYGFRMTSLDFLDEMTSTLSLQGWFSFKWTDENLRWQNDSTFSNIRRLVIAEKIIWTPEISVVSSTQQYEFVNSGGKHLFVDKSGIVSWFPTGRLTTNCVPNLRLFPFDTQTCDIDLECWTYISRLIKILPDQTGIAFRQVANHWTENSQWQIIGNTTLSGNRKSYGSNGCYSFVTYRLILKRKPLFEIINVVLPSMIIGASETVVFYLPCNDPTRVQISVTCLLAYTVFQSMIMQSIPKSIGSVPLLSLFIDLQMAYIGLIAIIGDAFVFSIVNSDFHRRAPSQGLVKIASQIGKRVGLKSRTASRNVVADMIGQVLDMAMDDDIKIMKEIIERWRRFTAKKLLDKQWLFIGQVIQRIILIIYTCLFLITPLALIAVSFIIPVEYPSGNRNIEC